MLNDETFARLVVRANLAPSVHNVQLTRWKLDPDGSVLVLEDSSRRLPVADPHGRDAGVSHGAAIEGFAIACAELGMGVDVEAMPKSASNGAMPSIARLRVREGAARDPLAPYVDERRSYRGKFAKAALPDAAAALESAGDLVLVRSREGIARLAALHDVGSLKTYRDAAYRRELHSWLRLPRSHPRWSLDGLNADEMAMPQPVALGADRLLAPGVFEFVDRLRLAAPLVAEAGVIRSSCAIALFHRPAGEEPLPTGRRFYRVWLEFSAAGLSAAPMSVLADDEELRDQIARDNNIPNDRRLINAFRLGVPPKPPRDPKPRLPLEELILQN